MYLSELLIISGKTLPHLFSRINPALEPLLAMAAMPTSTAEAKDLVQKLRSDPDNVGLHQVVRGACTAETWVHMSEAGYVEFFIEYMESYEHGDVRSVCVSFISRGPSVRALTQLGPRFDDESESYSRPACL